MKTCPKCQAEYDDSLSFCLQDGTRLGEDAADAAETALFGSPDVPEAGLQDAVTEELSGRATAKKRAPSTLADGRSHARSIETEIAHIKSEPRGTGYGILLGALLAIGLLALGVVIGGFFWFMRGNRPVDVATANSNQAFNLNAPQNLAVEGSNANLPQEIPANANLTVNTESTPKPEPTPDSNPTEAKTPEEIPEPPPPPPKPTRNPAPARTISGGVLNGKAVSLPKPGYPAMAKAVGASGAVNVKVLIDEDGNVVRANAVSGHRLLRGSAEKAARDAKFKPRLMGGEPVKVSGVIVYVFRPN